MILERVEWLVSTAVETCWLRMKDERKRMNALGGRGMCPEGLRAPWCVWEGLCGRAAEVPVVESALGAALLVVVVALVVVALVVVQGEGEGLSQGLAPVGEAAQGGKRMALG